MFDNPIKNFSWHEGVPILELDNPTIQELEDTIKDQNRSFVLYESQTRTSALIVPHQAMEIIMEQQHTPNTYVTESELLSEVMKTQVVVSSDEAAVDVANYVEIGKSEVVIIKEFERPIGVFLPSYASKTLSETLGIEPELNLREKIEAVNKKWDSPFHAEFLNKVIPDTYWCAKGHSVDSCPCDEHPNAGCKKL
ncbi:hypothetical protein MYX64_04340 [Nitrospinae bacterium AH_259_B05_G02_I21]|nr:hypothetical protein [Nitrospinae bacterium AH_259_B05_G02_I21]MDA2932474.1 hypothetical protein [Nitrospinae bacterium AH-259-F20]